MAIDDYHKHELLDRIHCMATMFDELVRDHPAASLVQDQVEFVSETLGMLYQRVAEEVLPHGE